MRKTISLLLAAAMVFSLAACGKNLQTQKLRRLRLELLHQHKELFRQNRLHLSLRTMQYLKRVMRTSGMV